MAVLIDFEPEPGLNWLLSLLEFAGSAVLVLVVPVPLPVLAGLLPPTVRTHHRPVSVGGSGTFGGAGGAIGYLRHLLTLKLIDDYFPVLKFDDFHACCS